MKGSKTQKTWSNDTVSKPKCQEWTTRISSGYFCSVSSREMCLCNRQIVTTGLPAYSDSVGTAKKCHCKGELLTVSLYTNIFSV